jgi:hypothetical protein
LTTDEVTIYDVISLFEHMADQAVHNADPIGMTELVEHGYEIMRDLDREMPGDGLEFRDRIARSIDRLCERIEEETEPIDFE